MNMFQDPASQEVLDRVARQWLGTPFHDNSAVRGPRGGVCCHRLPPEILFACGLPRFPIPKGPAGYSQASKVSIIEPAVDALPAVFAWVNIPGQPVVVDELRPGDMLGFRIGGCLHHLGLVLPGQVFIHVLRHPGVLVSRLDDSSFLFDRAGRPRLLRAWRP